VNCLELGLVVLGAWIAASAIIGVIWYRMFRSFPRGPR